MGTELEAVSMRYGAPILRNRIAPRCSFAEGILIVTIARGRRLQFDRFPISIGSPFDLVSVLKVYSVETLVCGGISSALREMMVGDDIEIVDNVACSIDELLDALGSGKLRSGYSAKGVVAPLGVDTESEAQETQKASEKQERRVSGEPGCGDSGFDCLECGNRVCLCGEICLSGKMLPMSTTGPEAKQMLDAGLDIAQEKSRRLCRLAEVVYFGLEMGYKKIGVAFCVEMWEPTQILVDVLKRFFEVVPVCCKVGGVTEAEMLQEANPWTEGEKPQTACNPFGQAWVLNRAGTQLNIIVGLCVGSDCLFAEESDAPVTTLFVKDKSLANNPIGALYSEYYLRENVSSVAGRQDMHNTGEKTP